MSADADRKPCPHMRSGACSECSADRIRALEAELAEARKQYGEEYDSNTATQRVLEQVALYAGLDIDATNDATVDAVKSMRAERDAAIAREQAAQADIAILDGIVQKYAETNETLVKLNKASTAAIETLAARVPLLEAVAKTAQVFENKGCAMVRWEAVAKALRKLAALDAAAGVTYKRTSGTDRGKVSR